MKHRIRINGEVKEIDCELGTGIFDKNGREIFEGDMVKNPIFVNGRLHHYVTTVELPKFLEQYYSIGDIVDKNLGGYEIVDD